MLKKLLPVLALSAVMLLAGCAGKGGSQGGGEGGGQGGGSQGGGGGQSGDQTVVFDFSSSAQRNQITTELQIWEEGGVTFKVEKNGATTAVADYTPVRVYKGHKITLTLSSGTFKSITFVTGGVAHYSNGDKSYDFAGSEPVTGGTLTAGAEGSSSFAASSGVSEITITSSVNQVRISEMTVTYTL